MTMTAQFLLFESPHREVVVGALLRRTPRQSGGRTDGQTDASCEGCPVKPSYIQSTVDWRLMLRTQGPDAELACAVP